MFKIVINNLWKNRSSVLASFLITTITFLILAISIITFQNIENITKNVSDSVTIRVIVDPKIKNEVETAVENQTIKNQIVKVENVETNQIVFISRTEDINNTIELTKNGNQTSPFEAFRDPEKNPLGNVFVVKIKDPEKIETTAQKLKSIDDVKSVYYLSKEVKEMLRLAKIVNYALLIFFALLVIATFLLIANVIKLSINMRKDEIEIMRLVGASNQYIKGPFIIEGMLISIVSSIFISICVLIVYDNFIAGKTLIGVQAIATNEIQNSVLMITTLIAIIVGYIGSNNAIRKYLKI